MISHAYRFGSESNYALLCHIMISQELKDYLYGTIVPRYAAFDSAHRQDHALTVMQQALKLLADMPESYADVREDILLTAAACHDLGLQFGRENHHTDSAKLIRADSTLRKWFNEDEIETIAQAAEDHRASGKSAPRSIYGMLVAEADRVIDAETIIRRTVQFGLNNHPELPREAQIERAIAHLREKYGRGGYLKLWISWSDNSKRLSALQDIIANDEAVRAEVERIYSHSMVADGFGERS